MNAGRVKLLIFLVLTGWVAGIQAMSVPASQSSTSSFSYGGLSHSDSTYLFRVFNEHEVKLDGWSSKDITMGIFSEKARTKAIKDFKYDGVEPHILRDFKAHFNGNRFNYQYEGSRMTMRNLSEDEEIQEYEVRKAFALHMGKKVGEYHFNRLIKYNPRIERVVKKVENIDITVKIAPPSKPGGKETKLKFRVKPFKTELKFQYLSPHVDGTVQYRIDKGSLDLKFEKPTEIASITFDYNVGIFKYDGIDLSRTFSVGIKRKLFGNVKAAMKLDGTNGNGARTLEPTGVHVSLLVPL